MTKSDDEDLKDVLRSERSRGRKQRVDVAAEKRQRKVREQVLNIFRHGSEEALRELLRSLNFTAEEIEEKVKTFRDERAKL